MHAMQYAITLPADYDMGIIRRRVATRGHLLDDFAGLGLKAYGIRERGKDGAPAHQYAPFYLWADPEAMSRFLLGAGFHGVISDFGRPVVQHWQGLFHRPGPAAHRRPGAFSRRTERLAEGADPDTAVTAAVARHERLAATDGVHSTSLALDPSRWELVHFTLWTDAVPEEAGDRYQVLHLSAPGMDRLRAGQQW
ncbi:DUF4865 family protein [Streptomyces sp. NPDC020742]|uniref:DUF4865 family protein n=1 Tax=unclassified Streptomyces TaxID=2593676 RepID=UPI003408D808